ncbi:Tim23p [Saccharomyces cerevisiae x Saccharomyces kudriavzevii VIN7]|uniref:Mitochondrial import inner membrane translocase subunit TIM23 n=1 Tax=Saccharomyces cerevisiae x Saccharomyces kudriavzevii (strain VIN7) TaxID=1095631 RepID=H0H0H8_SACCK|nr:Tim23p [Saccharomyces cerevisiae x Saccharomyces kudriavzevii VIN7]
MSWLFGNNTPAADETAGAGGRDTSKPKELSLKQSLGFEPNINNIISGPGGMHVDTARLHPLAGLDKGVEYLDLEDEQLSSLEGSQGLIPSRGWTDDLCYGTGAVYLLGLGVGGVSGMMQGLQNIPANSPGKLQLNTVLNHITKRGPFLGNNAGILALSYNIVNSTIDTLRGKHDTAGSVGAGALTGALFKSSKGLKPMGYSSVMVAAACAVWCGVKKRLLQKN